MRRYQVGLGGERWSKLFGSTWAARRLLWRRIRKAAGIGKPVRWWEEGQPKNPVRNPRAAAKAIISDAKARRVSKTYHTSAGVDFRLLVGEVEDLSRNIPSAAMATEATKLTLAYHAEISLVFPAYKTLGLYVPRKLKDGSDYWSEHAWAAACDVGMRKAGGGYQEDPKLLGPFLAGVNAYVLANYDRLKVNETIYDRKAYESSRPHGYSPHVYTGSDPHQTHTHTQFADHRGTKPPWL